MEKKKHKAILSGILFLAACGAFAQSRNSSAGITKPIGVSEYRYAELPENLNGNFQAGNEKCREKSRCLTKEMEICSKLEKFRFHRLE